MATLHIEILTENVNGQCMIGQLVLRSGSMLKGLLTKGKNRSEPPKNNKKLLCIYI